MAQLHQIQKGQKWLETGNFCNNNEKVHIELDPLLSPTENAERYYARFKKAKSGLGKLQDEIESLQEELEQLERTYAELYSRGEPAQIHSFIRRNRPKKKQKKKDSGIPGLQFSSHGFTLLLGRNARENDALLRKHTRGNDYWLHSRDYPGAYVFIRNKAGKSVPLDVLLDAGNLALHYSKAKHEGGGELYYTQVKYLRRAKDGKTGLVIPTQEKNLSVEIDTDRLERMRFGNPPD
jgi:predicted ribosome quality control (RQC) complex YloA/Tae2 family protein